MLLDNYFEDVIEYDFFRMFCGKKLGSGSSREVWEFGFDDKYVIKFEGGDQSFQNVTEWSLWHDAKMMNNGCDKWLAPCHKISPCGRVLIQRRTTPAKHFPKKMPAFLSDFKKPNFGMIGKRFVSHDYGTHIMCNDGLWKFKMQKAKWHEE